MPRRGFTPLTRNLRESLAIAREGRDRQIPLEEVAEERCERRAREVTRREFLGAAVAASAGLALWRPLRVSGATSRIAVVGAGLAGLRFAHALWTRRGIA